MSKRRPLVPTVSGVIGERRVLRWGQDDSVDALGSRVRSGEDELFGSSEDFVDRVNGAAFAVDAEQGFGAGGAEQEPGFGGVWVGGAGGIRQERT